MDRETNQKRASTIKKLLNEGYSVSDLASIFGLSTQSIWRIKYTVDNSELDKVAESEYNSKQEVNH